MSMKITTLIVDSDASSRTKIREFLSSEPEIVVTGECGDGLTAARMIEELVPQLIFLDIEIPESRGFEALHRLDQSPVVVFLTQQREYSVQKIEEHALDYLQKPLQHARFASVLAHAKEVVASRGGREERFLAALRELARHHYGGDVFPIKSNGRFILLRPEEIKWVQAERDYVRFHAGKSSHLVRGTMSHVLEKLDPAKFARIHRSTIVNLRFVRETQPLLGGDYAVVLRDGTQLTLSRGQRAALARLVHSQQQAS